MNPSIRPPFKSLDLEKEAWESQHRGISESAELALVIFGVLVAMLFIVVVTLAVAEWWHGFPSFTR